jgi:DNA-binding CsgD family transcriptional regulator
MEELRTNPELELAFELIRFTNKSLFLTGKAGSGKTTFLRQISSEAAKRMAVVAPTGVAAINAGGMTIHSLFQIPFGFHLPGVQRSEQEHQRKFSGSKIRLLQSLDLLVIDEISMVRADLLDAVDEVLRRYRHSSQPFGGLQMLMIGDLHQLPPVIKPDEWQVLQKYYQSPYFFSSLALQKTDYQSIELKHIYRQSDAEFIGLLNQVRDNCLNRESLRKLNTRYVPGFQPPSDQSYITLTTTNATAQEINASNLRRLSGKPEKFSAKILGNFPESFYPTEVDLEFKAGAQVMFIKNDPERRFYNGKIGQIVSLDSESIQVVCPGDPTKIDVIPVEWKNVKYSLNEQSKQIEEEALGSFIQMPLKLAWAITIHKSQGLTFERAIIDAQSAFASGQVYVALSRCKSFEGIVLRTPVMESSVKTDMTVKQFTDQADRNSPDEAFLRNARREFEGELLRELFSFDLIQREFEKAYSLYWQNTNSLTPEAVAQLRAIKDQASQECFTVVQKFSPQLDGYLQQDTMPSENAELRSRVIKAAAYFSDKLDRIVTELKTVPTSTDNQAVNTSITAMMSSLQFKLFAKSSCFKTCCNGFSSSTYQRAKVDAELDFSRAGSRSGGKSSLKVPKGVPHPELYRQLLEWRLQKAEENEVGAQAIFPNATLRGLVDILPVVLVQFAQVPGIGSKRLKAYGTEICKLIQTYCDQHKIATNDGSAGSSSHNLAQPAAILDSAFRMSATKKQSFDLFREGKSLEEIAAARGVTRSTVVGHLVPYIATGEIDIFALMSQSAITELTQYILDHPQKTVTEIKLRFGNKYGYGEIKMVIAYQQHNVQVRKANGQ